MAELTADDETAGVVGLATSFRLASLDATPAAELARRLTVVPEIGFSVKPDVDGRSVRITPDEPLAPGAVYRFTLAADDGRTLDSWAFQAHQPLRVIATLPRDTEADVPLDTGIEITFDQDGVVDAASHVTIEPKVEGRFEQHGRVLAFVPEHPLDPATLYTITVTRGVEVGATGEELESDVRFRFETALAGQTAKSTTFQFADDVFESPTSERPVIALWAFQETDEGETEPVPPTSAPIEVHRLRRPRRGRRCLQAGPVVPTLDARQHRGPGFDHRSDPGLRVRCRAPGFGRHPLVQPARAAARRLVSRDAARARTTDPGDAPGHRYRRLPGRLGDEDPRLGERPRDWRPGRRSGRQGRRR